MNGEKARHSLRNCYCRQTAGDIRGLKHLFTLNLIIGECATLGCVHITLLFILLIQTCFEGVCENFLPDKDMARQESGGRRLAWLYTSCWMTERARKGIISHLTCCSGSFPPLWLKQWRLSVEGLKLQEGTRTQTHQHWDTQHFSKKCLISVQERSGHYRYSEYWLHPAESGINISQGVLLLRKNK